MSNSCFIYKIDSFAFIGKNLAAYIKQESLDAKIASLARCIFLGFFSFFCNYYFLSVSLLKILSFSVGMPLLFLFIEMSVSDLSSF